MKEFQTVAVGRIEGVAVVTGIFYMKMFWRFAGTKKSGCNNEVIVMRGSTVLRFIKLKLFYQAQDVPLEQSTFYQ